METQPEKQWTIPTACFLRNIFHNLYGLGGIPMDRRQKKTRDAVFSAFSVLAARKSYNKITVQEIIDAANVGRTTFYRHFETKDALLRALCEKLFGHIVGSAMDSSHTHGLYSDGSVPESVFLHLLQHLEENDSNILGLLSSESSDIFLRFFKDSLNDLVRLHVAAQKLPHPDVPQDFLVNHISGSFVEMVLWWIKGGRRMSPAELDRCFCRVIEPILKPSY